VHIPVNFAALYVIPLTLMTFVYARMHLKLQSTFQFVTICSYCSRYQVVFAIND